MSFISDLVSGGLSGIISPITTAITAIFTKKEDVSLEKFKVEGKVDLGLIAAYVELMKAKTDLLKNKWIVALQVLFGLPLAFYYGKALVWDAALHLGTTDAMHGQVATWNGWIVAFLFAHSALDSWNRKT